MASFYYNHLYPFSLLQHNNFSLLQRSLPIMSFISVTGTMRPVFKIVCAILVSFFLIIIFFTYLQKVFFPSPPNTLIMSCQTFSYYFRIKLTSCTQDKSALLISLIIVIILLFHTSNNYLFSLLLLLFNASCFRVVIIISCQ